MIIKPPPVPPISHDLCARNTRYASVITDAVESAMADNIVTEGGETVVGEDGNVVLGDS